MKSVPAATRFPVEVTPPDGFDPDDLRTWPDESGRFEYVDGRLLYMPPAAVPPILAVEVAGEDDTESLLRAKADWYLARGVTLVWLVLPATREVVVMRHDRAVESRYRIGDHIPEEPELPGLAPAIADFFRQLTT